jgi:hypothetical protein
MEPAAGRAAARGSAGRKSDSAAGHRLTPPLGQKERPVPRAVPLLLLVRTSSARAVGTAPSGRLLSCDRRQQPHACYSTIADTWSRSKASLLVVLSGSEAGMPGRESDPKSARRVSSRSRREQGRSVCVAPRALFS